MINIGRPVADIHRTTCCSCTRIKCMYDGIDGFQTLGRIWQVVHIWEKNYASAQSKHVRHLCLVIWLTSHSYTSCVTVVDLLQKGGGNLSELSKSYFSPKNRLHGNILFTFTIEKMWSSFQSEIWSFSVIWTWAQTCLNLWICYLRVRHLEICCKTCSNSLAPAPSNCVRKINALVFVFWIWIRSTVFGAVLSISLCKMK